MYRIMVIDDEQNVLKAIHRTLMRDNALECEVECFNLPEEALARAEVTPYELFLSDYRMPKMNGVEFLSEVKDIQPDSVRIILSGYNDLEALKDAINKAEIYRFLSKPWQDDELCLTVLQALKHRDILNENKFLAKELKEHKQAMEIQQKLLEKACSAEENNNAYALKRGTDGELFVDDNS